MIFDNSDLNAVLNICLKLKYCNFLNKKHTYPKKNQTYDIQKAMFRMSLFSISNTLDYKLYIRH